MVVLAVGMVPNSADGELIRELHRLAPPGRNSESSQVREKSAKRAEELGRTRGHRDPPPRLPPGPGSAGPQVRVPGLALHLLPLRNPANRHLCRRRRSRAHGLGPGRRGRVRRRHEGGPVHRNGQTGRGGPPARRRHRLSRTSSSSAAPSANAAPRSAPSAPSTRTPKGRRSSSRCAAAAAASAWVRARSGSSPSRTTRST